MRTSRLQSIAPRHPLSRALRVSALCTLLTPLGCVEQQSPEQPTEEDVKAAREHILQAAPTPKFPVNAVLTAPAGQGKGKLTYLGMDIDQPSITAGQSFTLTHYWRVEEPVEGGWRLFIHLGAPGDKRAHLNADHVPIGGKYPIARWQKGEIIRDIHKVSLPTTWAGDKLIIYTGLWKGQVRFKIASGPNDGQDRVIAATVPVTGGQKPAAPAGKRIIARKLAAGATITVDGKLDDADWKTAPSTGPFVNTMNGTPVDQAAEAKVLWDDKNLYVAFDFADKDVWGSLEKHDDKLWTQEVAELFINADGDDKTYVELQVSPRNVTFDSWLPAYRQNDNAWNAEGWKTAVQVRGTLDKRDDADQGWSVEMAIPIAAVKGRLAEMKNVPPALGTEWRVNFFRMDMPAGKPQAASAWSPPLVPDFHAIDKFGTLVFGDELGNPPLKVEPAIVPGRPGGPGPHPLNPISRKLMVANPAKASQEATQSVPPPEAKGDKPGAKPDAKGDAKGAPKGDARPDGKGAPKGQADKADKKK